MANPHRGEVAFSSDGKDYILCFSTNALCEMEDALGMGVAEVGEAMSSPEKLRMKTARGLFWAGLQDNHPSVSLRDAGKLMTDVGLATAIELIGSAFGRAFPNSAPSENPQKPGQGGTGPAS